MSEAQEQAVKTFIDLGINDQLVTACEMIGWKNPTSIQIEAIPHALEGNVVFDRLFRSVIVFMFSFLRLSDSPPRKGFDRTCTNRFWQDRSICPSHLASSSRISTKKIFCMCYLSYKVLVPPLNSIPCT